LRIQKYQSDWPLQLLLTLAAVMDYRNRRVLGYRKLEILLEMDNPDLHLADWDSVDLRYSKGLFMSFTMSLNDTISLYADGDSYSSAALHCMRFLSNPP
jgi:hypothetical protein